MNPASSQETLSILVLDIGNENTRALLFDVVEGSYHFISAGTAASTDKAPINDLSLGVMDALKQLEEITGRVLLNQRSGLILPSQAGNEGVDRLFITYSSGRPLRIAAFALMGDVSLQSLQRLAATVNGQIVQSISLNDRRIIHDQIDDTLLAQPELILFAGGTDRGATRSVKKMANLIAAILRLMPQEQRPPVVYCGNQLMTKPVKEILEAVTKVDTTMNIRPEMDEEEIDQVAESLAEVVTNMHLKGANGLVPLASLCSDAPCPSATAIGRIVQYLSQVGDPEKGILAIDLGSVSTITASARAGKMDLNVLPFGSGQGLQRFLDTTPFEEIAQWLPPEMDAEEARDQLWQKTLFPASVPMTQEALFVEQAATRQMLRRVTQELDQRAALIKNGYDSIILSGSAITQIGTPSQILLTLLDGLQPQGVSTFVLDPHAVLAALGATARVLPILPVQVLETKAFTNLATVVAIESSLRNGGTLATVRLRKGDKVSKAFEIKEGTLTVLPLKIGETATLEMELNRAARIPVFDLNEPSFKVRGGLCGIVIDTRHRPLQIPADKADRAALFKLWKDAVARNALVQ